MTNLETMNRPEAEELFWKVVRIFFLFFLIEWWIFISDGGIYEASSICWNNARLSGRKITFFSRHTQLIRYQVDKHSDVHTKHSQIGSHTHRLHKLWMNNELGSDKAQMTNLAAFIDFSLCWLRPTRVLLLFLLTHAVKHSTSPQRIFQPTFN